MANNMKLSDYLRTVYEETLNLAKEEQTFNLFKKYLNLETDTEKFRFNTLCFKIILNIKLIKNKLYELSKATSQLHNQELANAVSTYKPYFDVSLSVLGKTNPFSTKLTVRIAKQDIIPMFVLQKLLNIVMP